MLAMMEFNQQQNHPAKGTRLLDFTLHRQ